MTPTREQALHLFRRHNENDGLYRHALAVEAVMRYFAELEGFDTEKWGIIGLVHDIDWGKWPDQHCKKAAELLDEENWPEEWIRSVLSHGWGMVTDVEPTHRMEKILYATDELTGLITATALVRPSRSLSDLTAKSVKKKWKDKGFSAGVDRSVIEKGAAMLDMDITTLINHTITAMQRVAAQLELA